MKSAVTVQRGERRLVTASLWCKHCCKQPEPEESKRWCACLQNRIKADTENEEIPNRPPRSHSCKRAQQSCFKNEKDRMKLPHNLA